MMINQPEDLEVNTFIVEAAITDATRFFERDIPSGKQIIML